MLAGFTHQQAVNAGPPTIESPAPAVLTTSTEGRLAIHSPRGVDRQPARPLSPRGRSPRGRYPARAAHGAASITSFISGGLREPRFPVRDGSVSPATAPRESGNQRFAAAVENNAWALAAQTGHPVGEGFRANAGRGRLPLTRTISNCPSQLGGVVDKAFPVARGDFKAGEVEIGHFAIFFRQLNVDTGPAPAPPGNGWRSPAR